jgi:hypothetical protein
MAGDIHFHNIPGWVWAFLIAALFFFGLLYGPEPTPSITPHSPSAVTPPPTAAPSKPPPSTQASPPTQTFGTPIGTPIGEVLNGYKEQLQKIHPGP